RDGQARRRRGARHARRLDARRPRRRALARAPRASRRRRAHGRRRERRRGRAAPARGARVRIEEHVPLSRFTTLGSGGPARWFARPETDEELAEALAFALDRDAGVAVVGLGSNLLVADG